MNYFELFELPVSLQGNRAELSKKYIELQRRYHPDFYTQANEEVQKEALEKSSLVNKAYKILNEPEQRIAYVLQLKGVLDENEKYALPPSFLMEMMELNENLTEQDPATFKPEVALLKKQLYDEVKNTIENYTDSTTTPEQLLKIKEYYFKQKYLHRILDRMDD